MKNLEMERPEGWAESTLAGFFEVLFNNTIASFDNLKEERRKLEAVDKIFASLMENFVDPEHQLPALLIIRSIGAYRIASLLSMTAPIDAYVSMRSCLEYAGYAHLIKNQPKLAEVWLRREDSEASRKLVRNSFTSAAVQRAIKSVDEDLARIYTHLYEETISNGAHPNERALTGSLHIERSDVDRKTYMNVLLLPEGGPTTRLAMRTCAQVGVAALRLSSHVLPARFKELGLRGALREASKGL